MIPLKLLIRNFLSYGPDTQTITFSPYRLICLSGKNGHGKSALLDAITWAIWGQARKISGAPKPDMGLMRLGQTHMLVSLDFLFNGLQYRAKREFSLFPNNKQVVSLDFGIWDEQTRAYKPLTGKTVRETQEHIEKTLNLDFDSFVNSAFLRQGQANEFSKKSPKERKEILAAILGLNKYDIVRTRALEKIRQSTTYKAQLLALQESRTKELEHAATITQALVHVMNDLELHEHQEKILAQEKTHLEQEQKKYHEQQRQEQFIRFQQSQLEAHAKELNEKTSILTKAWRITHKKMLLAQDPILLETEKKELSNALRQEQQKLQKELELKQRLLLHKEKIQRLTLQFQEKQAEAYTKQRVHVERVQLELHATQAQLMQIAQQQITAAQEKSRIDKEITIREKNLAQYKKVLDTHDACIRQFEKRKEHYQRYIAQGNLLKTEHTSLLQKKQLAHDKTNPCCPLCEQNLSAARKRFLKQKFEEQEQFLTYRIGKLSNLIQTLKTILITQHETVQSAQKIAQAYAAAQAEHSQLTQAIHASTQMSILLEKQLGETREKEQALIQQLAHEEKKLVALEKVGQQELQEHQEYKTLSQTLKKLEQEITDTAYDEKKYTQFNTRLQHIDLLLSEHTALDQEQNRQENRKQEITQLIIELKKLKKELKNIEEKLKEFEDLPAQEKAISQQAQLLECKSIELTSKKEKLMLDKGSLETQQRALEKIKKEQAEHHKLLTEVDETIDDYQTIAHAMSKDGIQALLIEEAIPEIEQAANDILSRLTHNQAHISIESLKDLKKGGTRETLDINISDTVGIRPYELFSGGEAFRIDFALRIAISKLLARRAGTSLQTLIIDEGFGSQDEEGLAHIMSALYAIQEDFSKIIIVSHLYSMKDQFPVHMVIEKGPQGSRVSVLEQG
jgi:exonuclease SbcC